MKRPVEPDGPSPKISKGVPAQVTLSDQAGTRQATSVIATIDLRAASRERRWLR